MMITIILTSSVHNAQRKHIVVPKGYTIVRSKDVKEGDLILNLLSKQFYKVLAGDEYIGMSVREFIVARKDNVDLELYRMYNPKLTFDELEPKNNEITITVDCDEETRYVSYLDKNGNKTGFNWNYFED